MPSQPQFHLLKHMLIAYTVSFDYFFPLNVFTYYRMRVNDSTACNRFVNSLTDKKKKRIHRNFTKIALPVFPVFVWLQQLV